MSEQQFDPKSTYISGGLNDSTGREPFEDPTRTFIPEGAPPAATVGHLHHEHGHQHDEGLHNLSTSSTTTGTNQYSNNQYTGAGVSSGFTGEHTESHHHHHHNTEGISSGVPGQVNTGLGFSQEHQHHGVGDHLKPNTRGDIKAGTSVDPAVGEGRNTGSGLIGGVTQQTGDQYGGVQTGTTKYGTGEDVAHEGLVQKIKQKVTGDNTTYGSDSAARDYDNSTSSLGRDDPAAGYARDSGGVGNTGVGGFEGREHGGPISGGAAGTDRFDTDSSKQHGVVVGGTDAFAGNTHSSYGNNVDEKRSNDHGAGGLSGITRHGDDFTRGDTADSAYKNHEATGLTGRENTTTGVHDQHGDTTAPHKEGLLDKVKHLIGGHTNTTHADAK